VRQRVRVNVAKTATKGYTADTTAEVEFDGDPDAALFRLAALLTGADGLARREIHERENRDRDQELPF
jgi:hypothetical protein